eukprot:CAMPEP_0115169596 /NCGR_PEP_ID=MMETSP0270-20121206/1348_1 /TAXON_ID=71861 /ORGANISM="Scrippsiella trochoidea, Strain CCMP3099" /LENGTH=159 /DNA_ID=CAMNT_0002582295 /DNA_START=645 /DNA_END=1124 /DNA_ORIENTATION=+
MTTGAVGEEVLADETEIEDEKASRLRGLTRSPRPTPATPTTPLPLKPLTLQMLPNAARGVVVFDGGRAPSPCNRNDGELLGTVGNKDFRYWSSGARVHKERPFPAAREPRMSNALGSLRKAPSGMVDNLWPAATREPLDEFLVSVLCRPALDEDGRAPV